MEVRRLTSAAVRADRGLADGLRAIAAGSFEDPEGVLELAHQRCSVVHLVLGPAGAPIGFFFSNTEPLVGDGRPSIYLGLSGIASEAKSTGVGRLLYGGLAADAASWEREHGERLVLWGKTATPTALRVIHTYFGEPEPSYDGRVSDEGRAIARHVRRFYGLPADDDDPPFVLRRASTMRFVEPERARMRELEERLGIRVFRDWAIDERAGDRVLLVCRAPR